jgi:hypothetical protein
MKSKSIATLATLVAVGAMTNFGPFTTAMAEPQPAEAAWKTIVIDVACDGNSTRMVGLDANGAPARGTTFIFDGKVYPGNSIPMVDDFDYATPGDIGAWHCRGTFNFDWSEILAGKKPHVATLQSFYFGASGDLLAPDSLRCEGMEGGVTSLVVFGGTGKYRAVIGEAKMETIGSNNTGNPNFRFTFKVRRGA